MSSCFKNLPFSKNDEKSLKSSYFELRTFVMEGDNRYEMDYGKVDVLSVNPKEFDVC